MFKGRSLGCACMVFAAREDSIGDSRWAENLDAVRERWYAWQAE
jgi:hypothetical protein